VELLDLYGIEIYFIGYDGETHSIEDDFDYTGTQFIKLITPDLIKAKKYDGICISRNTKEYVDAIGKVEWQQTSGSIAVKSYIDYDKEDVTHDYDGWRETHETCYNSISCQRLMRKEDEIVPYWTFLPAMGGAVSKNEDYHGLTVQGYLPGGGEILQINIYADAIEMALAIIGAEVVDIHGKSWWASEQYDYLFAWRFFNHGTWEKEDGFYLLGQYHQVSSDNKYSTNWVFPLFNLTEK